MIGQSRKEIVMHTYCLNCGNKIPLDNHNIPCSMCGHVYDDDYEEQMSIEEEHCQELEDWLDDPATYGWDDDPNPYHGDYSEE
jgi:hypothetical protein